MKVSKCIVCVMDIAGEIVALKVQTRTGQVEVQLLNLEDF